MSEKLITPGAVQEKEYELASKPLPDDVVRKINEAIMRAHIASPHSEIIRISFSESGDNHSIPMKYQLQVIAAMKITGFIYYGRPNTLTVKFALPISTSRGENMVESQRLSLITADEIKQMAKKRSAKVLPDKLIEHINELAKEHMYSGWFWLEFGNESGEIPYKYERALEYQLKSAGYQIGYMSYVGDKVHSIRVLMPALGN